MGEAEGGPAPRASRKKVGRTLEVLIDAADDDLYGRWVAG
jgi:hypothetical protein